MKTSNESTARFNDVIELGVASVETKGVAGTGEPEGQEMGIGISED
ncbi:benenodin family lasso peptide [Luteimonas sp. R10]|nr:benenodin family lasso peptide [Luteimonas sp. R10]